MNIRIEFHKDISFHPKILKGANNEKIHITDDISDLNNGSRNYIYLSKQEDRKSLRP